MHANPLTDVQAREIDEVHAAAGRKLAIALAAKDDQIREARAALLARSVEAEAELAARDNRAREAAAEQRSVHDGEVCSRLARILLICAQPYFTRSCRSRLYKLGCSLCRINTRPRYGDTLRPSSEFISFWCVVTWCSPLLLSRSETSIAA